MNDTVALIVDPDFSARIPEVVARVRHTWVVATPANVAVAEQIWKASPNSPGLNTQGGVTTFIQYGADRESGAAQSWIRLTHTTIPTLAFRAIRSWRSMEYRLPADCSRCWSNSDSRFLQRWTMVFVPAKSNQINRDGVTMPAR